MTTKSSKIWIAIAGVLVASLILVLWPLFLPGFFVSDDGEWMVIRLSAFYQSLSDGQFPVRYLGRLNNSYGYPVSNFLYPGFLYIGTLIRLFGLSFPDIVKLLFGVSVAVGTFVTYGLLRVRFRKLESLLGAVSFVFSPYLLFDIYKRGSVGEVLAIAVSSVALLAYFKSWTWLFAPAVALLLISHNTVALIVCIVLFFLIVVHPNRRDLAISGLFGIGAATFFWLPALIEKKLVYFDDVLISTPSHYFVNFKTFNLFGVPSIFAILILFLKQKKAHVIDSLVAVLFITGIFLSTSLSSVFWNIPAFAKLVQFPYRFLVLAVLFGPWVVARALETFHGNRRNVIAIILGIICVFQSYPYLASVQYIHRSHEYYTTNEATTTVANEYMPIWVSEISTSRAVETLEVSSGDATLSQKTFIGENFSAKIDAKVASVITINKIYYPGWGITIDNRKVPIDYANPRAVMRIQVPQGSHLMNVSFRETPFRFFADVLSAISVVGYFIFLKRVSKKQ